MVWTWSERSRWLFTKADCSQIFKSKIEARPERCSQWWSLYSFQASYLICDTLAANFGCYRFRIMPDIVSKLWHTTVWSVCAVKLESELTPFSLTGRLFWSAALHRLGTCCFVFMLYLYSENDECSQGSAKWWALLWSVTTFRQLHHSCWLSNWVSITRVVASFPLAGLLRAVVTAADSESYDTLCLCLPVQPGRLNPPQAVPERSPKSSAIDFAVKPFCLRV